MTSRCPRCGRSSAWCHCTDGDLRRHREDHWLTPVPRRWDIEDRCDEAIEEKRRQERARERREEEAREAERLERREREERLRLQAEVDERQFAEVADDEIDRTYEIGGEA